MLRGLTVALSAAVALTAAPSGAASRAVGLPWAGRLVDGVQLPARGPAYFTWDPVLHRSPDRGDRRWGTARLVRLVLDVTAGYARAHPGARPLGIGDLSRPHGGPFGPKHASHQNGLDVDVYYPRADRLLKPPDAADQIDRRLAQELLDRFVRAGSTRVYVGPNTHLAGPRAVVQVLAGHDNHLHVRIAPRNANLVIGRSVRGAPIRAVEVGDPAAPHRILVLGCIHGTECAGTAIARTLARARPHSVDLWIVPNLDPDGLAAGTRLNGRGVDLNRNFPQGWRGGGRPGDPQYPGSAPFSEPETRIAAALVRRLRPEVTIWYHQPLALVRAWSRSVHAARRYAQLARLPFRRMRWLAGTAPNWQNHRGGGASFVVELPPGPLSPAAAARHTRAVLRLAQ